MTEYDNEKVKAQSYSDMFKERGKSACFKSSLLMIIFFILDAYILKNPVLVPSYLLCFAVLFFYEAFRPKVIVKLREKLNVKS